MKTTIEHPPPKRFGARYPWEDWFSQAEFTLLRGRDYLCRTSAMVQQVYQASTAERHNVKVKVTTAEDEQSIHVVVEGARE